MVYWEHIEGAFATQYRLSSSDIFAMTWRRFRILLKYIPPLPEEEDDETGSVERPKEGKFDIIRDMDKLMGREPATTVSTISMDDYIKREMK